MPYIGNQPGTGVRNRFIYTATASQTTFTGADNNGKTLKYADSDFVDVFLNGVCLVPAVDYTSTTKTSVVLTQAASLNDTLEVLAYDIATIADTVSKADGGTFEANVTFAAAADIITETLGTDNVRLGENAGDSIASGGNQNVVIGKDAGTAITTGDANVAVGFQALKTEDANSGNTAIGYQSLEDLNAGADSYNTAVGYISGTDITTGIRNTIIGAFSGDDLTDADFNVTLGFGALGSDTKGNKSIAIGADALTAQNFTSSTDSFNVAVGHNAGAAVTTGTNNTTIGSLSGQNNTTGSNNVFVGMFAGNSNTTGSFNTFVGRGNGFGAGDAMTTGSKNVILGAYDGNEGGLDIRTSDNNIVLSDGDGNPRIYVNSGGDVDIGGLTVGAGNLDLHITPAKDGKIQWNSSGGTQGFIYTNGLAQFIVQAGGSGGVYLSSGGTSWNSSSDERLKTITGAYTNALDDLEQINPIKFTWSSDTENTPQVGVTAQSVQAVVPEAVGTFTQDDDDTEYLSVRYTELIPIMIAALKEAKTKIETLENQNTTQATQIADLITRVETLEAE